MSLRAFVVNSNGASNVVSAGLLITFVIAFALPGTSSAAEKQWQAGVAKVNITPELPIWLSGYGGRNKPAATKHDDLWAKALVIEDAAGHRAVLVTMDLVGIDRELSQTVCQRVEEKYKLPRAAIALCASHTHSGPVVRGNLMAMYSLDEDQSRRVKEYKDEAGREPGPRGRRSNRFDSAGHNRHGALARPGSPSIVATIRKGKCRKLRQENKLVGPIDHELPVLAVQGDDGKLRAIVAGYACHATVLDGYVISADWPGAGQNELERRHPGTIALFVAGCGGDQNPLPRRSVDFVKKYGNEFADGVDAALKSSLKPIAPSLESRVRRNRFAVRQIADAGRIGTRRGRRPEAAGAVGQVSDWRNGTATASCRRRTHILCRPGSSATTSRGSFLAAKWSSIIRCDSRRSSDRGKRGWRATRTT